MYKHQIHPCECKHRVLFFPNLKKEKLFRGIFYFYFLTVAFTQMRNKMTVIITNNR